VSEADNQRQAIGSNGRVSAVHNCTLELIFDVAKFCSGGPLSEASAVMAGTDRELGSTANNGAKGFPISFCHCRAL
jgi:hypothetical protein